MILKDLNAKKKLFEKSLAYQKHVLKVTQDKAKLYERDILSNTKAIKEIQEQIDIKNYYLDQLKNKVEDKLLDKCDLDIVKVVVKKEKS